ncbi:MAG: hypothetical protein U1E25_03270 [Methylocystis sp.]
MKSSSITRRRRSSSTGIRNIYLRSSAGPRPRDGERPAHLVEVQHHHAHVVACLAEWPTARRAAGALGIVLDGLGFGDDGTIWGGEFLYPPTISAMTTAGATEAGRHARRRAGDAATMAQSLRAA